MAGLEREWAAKLIEVIIITSMFFRSVSGINHPVGGAAGWKPSPSLRDWAAKTPFEVGDFLVFSFSRFHNVLEVNSLDFDRCNPAFPIRTYNDRGTVIQLTQPGPRYFICGRGNYCKSGLKIKIQVLPRLSDDDDSGTTSPPTISPSSSPAASPPSAATSAPPHGAGKVRISISYGYFLVIIFLLMLVSCCSMGFPSGIAHYVIV